MAQVDYYKFFKKFPKFIDIDDTDAVKLVLLQETKRMKDKLLPINVVKGDIEVQELRDKGFRDAFKVTYKRNIILHVVVINGKTNPLYPNIKFPYVDMYRPYTHGNKEKERIFLSKEEVTNIKRTILIDDMLKNKKKK